MVSSISPLQQQTFTRINQNTLERDILPHVFKPARYLGVERGAYHRPFEQAQVRMALVFPELYEIGISNHAHKLLYSLINQQAGMMCDRAYAPDVDFKTLLAQHAMPLYGVESKMPLAAFDMLAISLQYELNYTTVLGTLDAARIPLYSRERNDQHPLIIGGGPGSTNPMPLSPFFDAFMIGDGEEVLVELMACIRDSRALERHELLMRLAGIEGVFIPGVSRRAYKRIVDIATSHVDVAPLLPSVGAVHDRVVVEARRGCDRMCRFCQPCFINLPVREQSVETIKRKALAEIEKTGYDECSLLSLSIADYSHFAPMIQDVAEALHEQNVSLSLPSQRADRFSLEVAEAVQSVRKSTLTFAPEAGTARLRDVINKNLTDDEIFSAVTTAFRAGWNKVKLYFMIGLPTETPADLDGIVTMVKGLIAACRQIRREPGVSVKGQLEINLTLSNFVPKPHTPFQWFAQDTQLQLKEKIGTLKNAFKGVPGVKINFTDTELSKLECVVSKGDADLAPVLERAYRMGAYLDAWGGADALAAWFKALDAEGIDPEFYTRERLTDPADPLPWDVIDVGLTRDWLTREYYKAIAASSTTPCFDECSVCGVCGSYSTQPKFIEVPKGGFKVVSKQKPVKLTLEPICRVRLQIVKKGLLRFISHLDWLRMFQRVVLRAKLPVAYSQGFNPRVRLSFSPALPMFAEAWGDWVDIELTNASMSAEQIQKALNAHLPADGSITGAMILPKVTPGIQKSIQIYEYRAIRSCQTDLTPVNIKEQLMWLLDQPEWLVSVKATPQQAHHPQPDDVVIERSSETKLNIRPYLNGSVQFLDEATVDFGFAARVSLPSEQAVLAEKTHRYINPKWFLGLLDPHSDWHIIRKQLILA